MIAEERLPSLRCGLLCLAMYLATEVWPISMPSLRSSPIKVTEPLIRQSSANYGDRNDIERITRAARKAAFALSAGEGRGV